MPAPFPLAWMYKVSRGGGRPYKATKTRPSMQWQLLLSLICRRSKFTKSPKQIIQHVPNPPLPTSNTLKLVDGSTVEEHIVRRSYANAPIVPNYRILGPAETRRMREMAKKTGVQSTGRIAALFGVSRSFVITHAFDGDIRKKLKEEEEAHLKTLSVKAARGFLYKQKLRQHRLQSS